MEVSIKAYITRLVEESSYLLSKIGWVSAEKTLKALWISRRLAQNIKAKIELLIR